MAASSEPMQGLHGEGDMKFYRHGDWLVLDSERQNMEDKTWKHGASDCLKKCQKRFTEFLK